MINGQIVLNGIFDPQLDIIIQVKEQHEASLAFNPQAMRTNPNYPQPNPFPPRPFVPGQPGQPLPPGSQGQGNGYDNVVLVWNNEDGLQAVMEILHRLMPQAPVPPFPPLPIRPDPIRA